MLRLFGRDVIYSYEPYITPQNVVSVLKEALKTHEKNRFQIDYLYNYYRGKQPIYDRKKQVRSDIKNIIVENRANEIVTFKTAFQVGEPIQYVSRSADKSKAEDLMKLNEYVFAEDKATKDKELCDWFHICGTSYRMALPDKKDEEDEAPFEIYTLDPRNSFVVYSSALGNKPLLSCKYSKIQKNGMELSIYSCYTDDCYYEIVEDKLTYYSPHLLGTNPIIEYPLNNARIGAFEVAIPILDAINNVSSNRMDAIEQFVQALLVFKGVDIHSEDYKKLKEDGAIVTPKDGDIKYIVAELNQMQTQTLVDYMYQTVLTICGMPNRNGGSSTSDTGKAVILRDGWSSAEARAKDTETMFKLSEKKFLRLIINISNTLRDTKLKVSDIDVRFTRRNHENILEKTQVLTTMLANPKIHPKFAFEYCGMFSDPELAYEMSREYEESQKAKESANEPTTGTDDT